MPTSRQPPFQPASAMIKSGGRTEHARHADTTCGAWIPRLLHMVCLQLVPRALQVRGGKREPGVNPGLPRSGERERQPSGPREQRAAGQHWAVTAWEATASRRRHAAALCPRVRRPASAPRATGARRLRPRGTADGHDGRCRSAAGRCGSLACSRASGPSGTSSRGESHDGHRSRPGRATARRATARRACRCASATGTPSRST